MEVTEALEEIPIKTKKPRSQKQIEAFQKALAKKAELNLINKEFNEAKRKQKDDVIEHKKRIIKTVKEPVELEVEEEVEVEPEVEPKIKVDKIKKPKKKPAKPVPIESESESEEEEEVIVKRKAKPRKKPVNRKIIYEDTSSEDSEDEKEQIVNYAKLIKKTSRERLKEELNNSKMQQAMSSLGYI